MTGPEQDHKIHTAVKVVHLLLFPVCAHTRAGEKAAGACTSDTRS